MKILIICSAVILFFGLGFLGIYFARKGMKTVTETKNTGFFDMKKLQSKFKKLKNSENRCVIYISVPLESVRRLYSDIRAKHIFSELMPIILKNFSDGGSVTAVYDGQNFAAVNNLGIGGNTALFHKCAEDVNHLMKSFNALKMANLRFGICASYDIETDFSDAVKRAKQACAAADAEDVLYKCWNLSGQKAFEKKISIENSIENELMKNRFFLEYQPVIDARTKEIRGAEVLARLNSETDGVISPKGFMEALGSVGISSKFDYYIFEKNCKWIANSLETREKYEYAVNFSRSTLAEPDFVAQITDILEKYGVKYSTVAIEVLEDKEITGVSKERIVSNLKMLKVLGIKTLLDDFGRGFTSFDDLQSLVFDTVKIDRSIIRNTDTEKGLLIFKNIVRTAREIGLKIICEGIETSEQESIAVSEGCDMLQGYYYYRPLNVTRLERLLRHNTGVEPDMSDEK